MNLGSPWVTRSLAIALAIAVGVFVYLAVGGGGESGESGDERPPAPQAGGARIVSEDELAAIAAEAGHPIYWAGEIDGAELELSEDERGTLVRYLEEDDEVGAGFERHVAVGSYAVPNPRKALDAFAETPGATVEDVPGIGKVVISPEAQKNVYFVDPGNEVQVEVYAPSAERAIDLVRSGRVQPLG